MARHKSTDQTQMNTIEKLVCGDVFKENDTLFLYESTFWQLRISSAVLSCSARSICSAFLCLTISAVSRQTRSWLRRSLQSTSLGTIGRVLQGFRCHCIKIATYGERKGQMFFANGYFPILDSHYSFKTPLLAITSMRRPLSLSLVPSMSPCEIIRGTLCPLIIGKITFCRGATLLRT